MDAFNDVFDMQYPTLHQGLHIAEGVIEHGETCSGRHYRNRAHMLNVHGEQTRPPPPTPWLSHPRLSLSLPHYHQHPLAQKISYCRSGEKSTGK